MIKKIIKLFLKSLSYEIKKIHQLDDLTFDKKNKFFFDKVLKICQSESLNISRERFLSLFQSINYIYKNEIDGDIVECGVFRGGSAMMIAHAMLKFNKNENKNLWLYDTFDGMSNPSDYDVNILNQNAKEEMKKTSKKENMKDIWAYSKLDYVKKNMIKTGLNEKNIIYVKGLVEKTLDGNFPEKISLLRLDTDFYESTKKELEILFPKLQSGGIIIIDDYGHWKGCKKAVDEYFVNKKNIFFQQIDYSGLIGVKTKS